MRADYARIDQGSTAGVMGVMFRYMRQANASASPLEMLGALVKGFLTLPQIKASFSAHCEVAQRLAERLGLEPSIVYALGQLYERWDGKGMPNGIKGEAVAPAVLVVTLAQDAMLFYTLGGVDYAVSVIRQRKGGAYAPDIAERFCAEVDHLLDGIGDDPTWDTVLSLEPGSRDVLTDEQFDNACRVMADFVDIKSSTTLNHSHEVASLAATAAQSFGLPSSDISLIRRAGWLHDLGKTGISSTILEKSDRLSEREWEKVRLHPYYTERILSHSAALAAVSAIASLHHEYLDGSGYHRGLPASVLPVSARILAAANKYQVLLSERPYREACSREEAAAQLKQQVHNGKLDKDAVQCVLAAAGHATPAPKAAAGLSEREVEVLRMVARGFLTRQIAEALFLSPKTVDHHIQHIYNKIGVSTRAGAALFAVENHLLG